MKKNNTSGVSSNSTPQPQAWVAVSNSRQKIYGTDKVYLDNDQEFQIELFNPTEKSYLTKIYLNGKSVSTSGLVIRPGQRYFLDRFIDEKRKLVFSTYEVEDTNEVKKAIESNGKIRVEFYPEQTPPLWYGGCTWTYYGSGLNTTLNNTGGIGTYTINTTPLYNNGFTTTSVGTSAIYNTSTYSAGSGSATSYSSSSSNQSLNMNIAGSLETGRVEKGEASDQTFGSDYGSYSSSYESVSEYQIMPRSTKPVEVSEIRSYCPGCGTRIKKSSWKFCPSCGESLD
jgi:hypothetical protein